MEPQLSEDRGCPRPKASKTEGMKGVVEVYPMFQKGLKGLDGFSHIILLCYFYKISKYNLYVVPPEDVAFKI